MERRERRLTLYSSPFRRLSLETQGPGESSIVFNSGTIRSGGGSRTGGPSGGDIAVGILNDNEITTEEGVCGPKSLITP